VLNANTFGQVLTMSDANGRPIKVFWEGVAGAIFQIRLNV
jgi:hypothetical protein